MRDFLRSYGHYLHMGLTLAAFFCIAVTVLAVISYFGITFLILAYRYLETNGLFPPALAFISVIFILVPLMAWLLRGYVDTESR